MSVEEQYDASGAVTICEARAELERLLSDSRFHVTDRAVSILRYLAEHLFQGQQEGVKAYAIAVDVLGRPSNFDPAIDPIVRIEVSRLRSALNQYYEAYAAETGVELQLPKGRYLAVFLRSSVMPRQNLDTKAIVEMPRPLVQPAPAEEPPVAPRQNARQSHVWKLPLAVATAAAAAVSVGLVVYGLRPSYTEKPTVSVTMTAAEARWAGDASVTRDMLLTALAQFQTLRLATATTSARPLAESLRAPKGSAYDIAMKYYGDGDDRSVWWQIVDTRTGDLLSSGLEHIDTKGKAEATVRNELVTTLSRRFAATRGAINNIETHNSAADSIGNACVLRAEYALDDGGPDAIAESGACLEKTLVADPNNADASAALSRVLIAGHSAGVNAEAVGRPINLANRAVSLAPLSDRAQIALMLAQFDSGRTDAAISAGNRALVLNPNNPEVSAKLAMVLFSAGYRDAGVSLAQDAGRSVDAVPRDAVLVLALDAYRRGDWAETSLLAEQVNGNDFVIRVLRAAALGQLGSDQAAARLDDAGHRAPEFETTFRQEMARRHFEPALAASIREGLAKAGLKSNALASAL